MTLTCSLRLPWISLATALLIAAGPAWGADRAKKTIYACEFSEGHWNRADWLQVKHPSVEHFGDWVQQAVRIANQVPEGATPLDLRTKRALETYAGMVYKEKVSGNVTISSTMAFADRTAPLILLVPELEQKAKGQWTYGEHYEIIIYNEGVNVWRYLLKDGKLTYRRVMFVNFPMAKDTAYKLEVKKVGKTLTVSVAGQTFGCYEEGLPDTFYAGITGCEGLNYFHDFSIQR